MKGVPMQPKIPEIVAAMHRVIYLWTSGRTLFLVPHATKNLLKMVYPDIFANITGQTCWKTVLLVQTVGESFFQDTMPGINNTLKSTARSRSSVTFVQMDSSLNQLSTLTFERSIKTTISNASTATKPTRKGFLIGLT